MVNMNAALYVQDERAVYCAEAFEVSYCTKQMSMGKNNRSTSQDREVGCTGPHVSSCFTATALLAGVVLAGWVGKKLVLLAVAVAALL